jgi:hypothetical protein
MRCTTKTLIGETLVIPVVRKHFLDHSSTTVLASHLHSVILLCKIRRLDFQILQFLHKRAPRDSGMSWMNRCHVNILDRVS